MVSRPAAIEATLVRAGGISVGTFRCAPSAPDFRTAGTITRHCIVFPRRAVWIQHEGQPSFVADSTRATLYNPRQRYERRAIDPAGDESDWFALPESIVRDVVAQHDPGAAESTRPLRFTHAPVPAPLYLAQRRLHHYVRRTPEPDPLFVEETAVSLFALTIAGVYIHVRHRTGGARPQITPAHRDLVERVRAHLNATFAARQTLDAIARSVGVSVFHLCRRFRRGTGMTLHAYRHHLRLRHALEGLGHEDLLSLALELGYSGHSHFTAAFMRTYGVTPSRVRRSLG